LVPASIRQSEGHLSLWLIFFFHVIVHLVSKFFTCNFNLENALFTIENLISLAASPFRQTGRDGICILFLIKKLLDPVHVGLFGLGQKPCPAILVDACLWFDAMVVAYRKFFAFC